MLASFRENRLTTISPEKREQLLRGSYCFAWADAEPSGASASIFRGGKNDFTLCEENERSHRCVEPPPIRCRFLICRPFNLEAESRWFRKQESRSRY